MESPGDALRGKITQALRSQRTWTITVLSSLLTVQDTLGYLPTEALEETADFTGSTINDVWGVASFYTNFRFTPQGEHLVELCWGLSCHLTGAPAILQQTLETLGVTEEGETPDNQVTLRYNTCLGACSQAPAISVDHKVIGRVSPKQIEVMLSALNGSREAV